MPLSAVFHTTIFSPSNVNGLGSAPRYEIGMMGYQKRRSTGCLVTSMATLRIMIANRAATVSALHAKSLVDELQRIGLPVVETLRYDAGVLQQLGMRRPAFIAHGPETVLA